MWARATPRACAMGLGRSWYPVGPRRIITRRRPLRAICATNTTQAGGKVETDFKPAVLVLEKSIPDSKRQGYVEWQSEAPKLVEKVLGPEKVIFHHRQPAPGSDQHDLVIALFRSAEEQQTWEKSEVFKEWIERGKKFQQTRHGDKTLLEMDGLGGWMAPTPLPAQAHPPKWKLACTVLLALYPTQQFMSKAVLPILFSQPWWPALPQPVLMFVSVSLVVPIMVNVSMPLSSKFLSTWFFKKQSLPRELFNVTLLGGIYSTIVYVNGAASGIFPLPPVI